MVGTDPLILLPSAGTGFQFVVDRCCLDFLPDFLETFLCRCGAAKRGRGGRLRGPRCGKRGEEFAFCFITTGKQCILKGECDSIV